MTAIAYLHGFTGAPSSWDGVRGALRGRGEEHLPTLLGHGSSGDRDQPRTLAEEVDRLAAEIARALPGERILAGYSLGARVGLGLLVRHPNLFRAAVLVSGQPALPEERLRLERAAEDESRARLLESEGLEAFIARWEALPLFASQHELPAPVREAERERRRSQTAAGLSLSLRCHGLAQMPWDLASLSGVRARVVLLAGARDAKFAALTKQTASALQHARVEIIEGAGHNILLERPEAVARALEAA